MSNVSADSHLLPPGKKKNEEVMRVLKEAEEAKE